VPPDAVAECPQSRKGHADETYALASTSGARRELRVTRIITADIKRLVRFYERITGTPLTIFTEDFAELNTPSATLAIGSTRTLQLFGGDVARAADNHSAIIEFLVDNVDAEYRKLTDVIKNALVQEPTTMPWGNRSLLFRDPDGNLVNFFTPVSPEAIKKLKKQT